MRHGLAERRLGVERALAGDDDVRRLDRRVEADRLGDEGGAGLDLPADHADQARGKPAARSAAGQVRQLDAEVVAHDARPAPDRVLEHLADLPGDALLRAVDARRALLAEQRVGDVDRDAHVDVREAAVDPGAVDDEDVEQVDAAGGFGQGRAIAVEQAVAERLRGACPPSLVAVPPTPTTSERAPRSSASRISSPTP